MDHNHQHNIDNNSSTMTHRGAIPLGGLSECGLPRELWEEIFSQLELSALQAVPLVCVFFHKQSFGNALLWRRKCLAVYGTDALKPAPLTWKQYYYAAQDLFPYRGIMLGVSTYEQLMSVDGAEGKTLDSGSTYVVIDQMSFWVREGVCESVSVMQHIPRRWQLKGLTWSSSYSAYKRLFGAWTGNYRVTSRPQLTQRKRGQQQWSAGLSTVVRDQLGRHYEIALSFFSLHGGSEDRTHMLSSVSLSMRSPAALEQTYLAQQCVE